jgi:DHA1 family 2-module integral membrane pump EmrD-like MFS transporter
LAPVLGGYLQRYLGWQANFSFMLLAGVILFIAIILFISETNVKKDQQALSVKRLLLSYAAMFSNIKFVSSLVCMTLAFGIMITFNVIGPFLLQDILNVSAVTTGSLLFLVGLAYLLGTSLNSQLLKCIKISHVVIMGIIIMLLSGVGLMIAGFAGWFTPSSVIIFTCLEIFATGFVFPNCFAHALEIFPGKLGTVGAIMGSSGLIGTSIISVLVAHVSTYNEQTLSYMFILQTLLCLIFYLLFTGLLRSKFSRC